MKTKTSDLSASPATWLPDGVFVSYMCGKRTDKTDGKVPQHPVNKNLRERPKYKYYFEKFCIYLAFLWL